VIRSRRYCEIPLLARWLELLALGLAALLLLGLVLPARALARPALELSPLSGTVELAPYCDALLDPGGALSLPELQRAPHAQQFMPAPPSMSFGFKTTPLWLRFKARNRGTATSDWVLELDYALLDYVTLYVVRPGGEVEERHTGDMLPYGARDMRAPNFAFRLENAPGAELTYYLRIQTAGSLRTPLTAQRLDTYTQRQPDRNVMLWMFYGALIVMALFNLGVYTLIHQSEYLVFTLLLASLGLVQFTLAGHTSEFLFPNDPLLANRTLPVGIALVLLLIPAFAASSFRQFDEFKRFGKRAERSLGPACVLLVFASSAPPGLGLRVTLAAAVLLTLAGPFLLLPLTRRRHAQIGLYLWSWYSLVIAVPVHALRSANLIPALPLTDFAVQIGIAIHGVITSLALATRLKIARDQLGRLNAQLSSNVSELRIALSQAEQASAAATQATLAKDQFMATMSHELRTPLNAIINVPQGLLDDFPELPAAECGACGARFLLDQGEVVHAELTCAECQAQGALHAKTTTKYVGTPAHTARFLRKIERSGKHLLQMVNGVLDFSKMQAGRLELSRLQVDVGALLHDTLDEMGELAHQRQLSLRLEQSGTPAPLFSDPVRLKQVLLNLLSNAIKFSEPEGTIVVRWCCQPAADVISVQDTGIGIALENQERIFGSFEQVHKGDTRKYGGTGLGLSISRSLVRMHGGEIWVESAEGKGSTFAFSIPR
jgi:signal transduction histidine kinase